MPIAHRLTLALWLTSTGIVAAGSVTAEETKPAPTATIGPFHAGMTFAELRAAAPTLEWKEGETLESRYKKTLKARDAVTLADLPYDVIATPGWYGEYELVFYRRAQVADGDACRKAYEVLLSDLEGRVGPLIESNHSYTNESTLQTFGRPTKTLNRKAGTASGYTWHSTATYDESSAEKHEGNLELTALGQYYVNSLAFGQSSCQTSFTIDIKGTPPAEAEIAAQSLKPIVTPSVALLHETMEGITVPKGGLKVVARCRLSREQGTVGTCLMDPKPSDEIAAAVNLRRAHMAFDTGALSPGNRVPLFGKIEFRFDPGQRLRLGAPTEPLSANAVDWKDEFEGVKRFGGLISGVKYEYDSAVVTGTCQIQADGSLLCTEFKVAPPPDTTIDDELRTRFENEARDRLRSRRAAASLKSGEPSAGRWVSVESTISLIRSRRP